MLSHPGRVTPPKWSLLLRGLANDGQGTCLLPSSAESRDRQDLDRGLDAAPLAWRFEIAEVSADGLAPLEFKVYLIRRDQRAFFGNCSQPMLSSLAQFPGDQVWTEETVLDFTRQEIRHRLLRGLDGLQMDIVSPQFP